ncbi:MAG: zinc ribbon domain-containing protein [Armatimonadota bacterium]|nr:zinc ribbon domain-containing protein [Armatimonadota bacterium]MDR7438358.1 zinc ribbon domain-containing protein [Armatimonadota bacterium]MDR7563376.1 zinc ribbon domain-containing protein [Armatimonadota bacterium]MDR7567436.1 zinc ribbon domain-containing protein [Armatimonadota bacterium]MDR7601679.1 zinc ribbon domain-containing protein [Armatimonadota bacterium]
MRCPKCGAENRPGKIVCARCGTRLRPGPSGPSPVTSETPEVLVHRVRYDLLRFLLCVGIAVALGVVLGFVLP